MGSRMAFCLDIHNEISIRVVLICTYYLEVEMGDLSREELLKRLRGRMTRLENKEKLVGTKLLVPISEVSSRRISGKAMLSRCSICKGGSNLVKVCGVLYCTGCHTNLLMLYG
jgi:hypothetical protein